jgi:hypothetical protein
VIPDALVEPRIVHRRQHPLVDALIEIAPRLEIGRMPGGAPGGDNTDAGSWARWRA